MTGRRIVTEKMADEIFKRYQVLKKLGIIGSNAFELIRSEIKRDYGRDVATGTIGVYATKGFQKAKEVSKYYREGENKSENENAALRVTNPYVAYLDSFRKFERGEAIELDQNNEYVRVLRAIDEADFSVETRGDRIKKRTGVGEVRKCLMMLNKHKLIEHETGKTYLLTKKGEDFLKVSSSKK